MGVRLTLVAALALGLASCKTDEPEPVSDDAVDVPEMDAIALAIRASLDLRGVRPSTKELDRVHDDPAAIDVLIDEWLQDGRFGSRVRDLFSEVYLTRTETYYIDPNIYGIDWLDERQFFESIGEEPLRIVERVAAEDMPITELVTGDWTMSNEVTEAIWPIDRKKGDGWQVAHYTDGRPPAGVLATNSMWWRYTSTDSNANRKRANAASRILLCHDYLTRPIDFDRNVNLLDEEAIDDALRTNQTCVGCHSSLDPLASYFFGFWWYDPGNPAEANSYQPQREQLWRDMTEVAPAYYGEPGFGLGDLGQQIAADPRFPQCMVEQSWELLLRRDAALADTDELLVHREALLEDLTFRSLFKSILSSGQYRSGPTDAEGYVPKKMVTPRLLTSQIEGLTGYRFTYEDWDMMASENVGFLTLAGGADGYFVTENARTPNTTLLLVQARLAEGAAWHAVQQGDLFDELDPTKKAKRAAMEKQVASLHYRIFGTRVELDGPEVEANLALYDDLLAVQGEPARAWAGVLTVLLRDPDLLFY